MTGNTFLLSTAGSGGIEIIEQLPLPDGTVKLVLQAIIAVCALIRMFWKPKEKKEEVTK